MSLRNIDHSELTWLDGFRSSRGLYCTTSLVLYKQKLSMVEVKQNFLQSSNTGNSIKKKEWAVLTSVTR